MLMRFGNVIFDDVTGDFDYIEEREDEWDDDEYDEEEWDSDDDEYDEHDYWEQLAEEYEASIDRLMAKYEEEDYE